MGRRLRFLQAPRQSAEKESLMSTSRERLLLHKSLLFARDRIQIRSPSTELWDIGGQEGLKERRDEERQDFLGQFTEGSEFFWGGGEEK